MRRATSISYSAVRLFIFLSTLSLRRATSPNSQERPHTLFLSTLSLRRATSQIFLHRATSYISIHALLAESDLTNGHRTNIVLTFLSTLSLRRATSIGTLRTVSVRNFYPRSPCGERHDLEPSNTRKLTFLSTLSLRRATVVLLSIKSTSKISIHALLAESDALTDDVSTGGKIISIHALLAESDVFHCFTIIVVKDFYPRSPCGERPHK